MRRMIRPSRCLNSQAGFSLLELLFACIVLVLGLLGVMGIFATAIGNNGRSKVDSTSTMLAQAVLEQIAAINAGGGPNSMTDCNSNTHTIAYTGSASPGAGAALVADPQAGTKIDFTQPVSDINPGYAMEYVVCSAGAQSPATYDVRWNITQVEVAGAWSQVITVAARPNKMQSGRFTFSLPVTLRLNIAGK